MPNNNKKKNKKNKQTIIQTKVISNPQPKRKNKKRRGGASKALRGVGGAVSSIGKMLGYPSIGRAVGGVVNTIFGQGDYIMNSPKQNSLMGQGPPTFSPLTSGFRLTHREYIRDVSSSIAFNTLTYQINPGLPDLFPWLSTIAANFEEYEIHGMVVYLNTTSGTAVSSTNTALGLWGCVTQYEPDNPTFTNKQQCENYVGCQTAVPFHSLMHGVECAPNSNVLGKRYVRTGGVDKDLKFYDWGKFQYFSQGSQASNVIGEMWVSYDISFYKPRLPKLGGLVEADFYDATATCTATNPFGSVTLQPDAYSNLGTTLGPGGVVNLPNGSGTGRFFAHIGWPSNTSAPTANSITFSGSLKYTTVLSASGMRFWFGTTFGSGISLIFDKVDVSSGSFTVQPTGLASPDLQVIIMRIPANLGDVSSVADIAEVKDDLHEFTQLLKLNPNLLQQLKLIAGNVKTISDISELE